MPAISVSKSIVIDAPPQAVFEEVRNFKSWIKWSPWLIAEPDARVTYDEDGNGYAWEGDVTGAGNMRIKTEEAGKSIESDLQFLKPWKSHADVRFLFEAQDIGTRVTWTLASSLPFFLSFMKSAMVTGIGMDYERGLKMLKDLVEKGDVPSKLTFSGESEFTGFPFVGIRSDTILANIGDAVPATYAKLHDWMGREGVSPGGPGFVIYHDCNLKTGAIDYTAGYEVADAPESIGPDILAGTLPNCRTWSVVHEGAYHHLGNAWSAGMMYERSKKFRKAKTPAPFEIYLNDPSETEPKDLRAVVHFPVR
ncbi:MAG: SRPBCC family protein [Verrucomicrobiota bacterium]